MDPVAEASTPSAHAPDDPPVVDRGSRLAAHSADCIIEAWGPDRVTCLVEAIGALVSIFAQVPEGSATTPLPVVVDPAPDPDLLVALLEEVIFCVDVLGKVPAGARLGQADGGGVAGTLEVVDAADVVLVGPVPKGVSWHGLEMVGDGGRWRCRVVVDV
jgi:SHS2 domain-containing protein